MTDAATAEDVGVNAARLAELRAIEKAAGGIVRPESVVEYAANPKTALHSAFCWDDTEAAHKYRVFQARQLLRVMVTLVDAPSGEPMRVNCYVALREDRVGDGDGGYRYMPRLMRSDAGRTSILETALAELDAFRAKYAALKELSEVFAAIAEARMRRA